jgi:hypothetical protein
MLEIYSIKNDIKDWYSQKIHQIWENKFYKHISSACNIKHKQIEKYCKELATIFYPRSLTKHLDSFPLGCISNINAYKNRTYIEKENAQC